MPKRGTWEHSFSKKCRQNEHHISHFCQSCLPTSEKPKMPSFWREPDCISEQKCRILWLHIQCYPFTLYTNNFATFGVSNYFFIVSSRYGFETFLIHMQDIVLGGGIQQGQGQTFCLPSKKLLSDGSLTENQNNRGSKRHCLVSVVRSSSLTPFSDCFYLPPLKLSWKKDLLNCLSMQKYTVSLRGNFIILV